VLAARPTRGQEQEVRSWFPHTYQYLASLREAGLFAKGAQQFERRGMNSDGLHWAVPWSQGHAVSPAARWPFIPQRLYFHNSATVIFQYFRKLAHRAKHTGELVARSATLKVKRTERRIIESGRFPPIRLE
jgi:hypothetical protein